MKTMKNQLILEAQARSNLYGLLARFCRQEMDAEFLAALRTPELVAALSDAGVNVAEALPEGDDSKLLEELATAYTYTFLLTLSPHESVQRGEGQLWGGNTVAVRDFMEELGLQPAGEQSLLPDHIAIELEIMQHLTEAEVQSLELENSEILNTARQKQKIFLKKHLGQWGPEFFGSVQRIAPHPFYREVGELGSAFLSQDFQSLVK